MLTIEEFRSSIYQRETPASDSQLIQGVYFCPLQEDPHYPPADYSSLLADALIRMDSKEELYDRFYNRRNGNLRKLNAEFGEFLLKNASPFSRQIQGIVQDKTQGKTFFDLGCGDPDVCLFPRFMARLFKAREYVGVDHQEIKGNHVRDDEFGLPGSFRSYFIRDDMLSFLSKIHFKGVTFFVSGIDDDNRANPVTVQYSQRCVQEMLSLCQSGEGIILHYSTRFMHPQGPGVRLVKCGESAIYIKE